MPEQLREQLETAIDLKLQEGVRHDFGSFLFPTSLLMEWYEKADIPSVYKNCALTDQACVEVIHQKKLEFTVPWIDQTISNYAEFIDIRLGVLPEVPDGIDRLYRKAHRLILNHQQHPLLVHTAQVGDSEQQNRHLAGGIDLEYFLRFIQESEAFAKGTLRLIR